VKRDYRSQRWLVRTAGGFILAGIGLVFILL